MPRRRTCRPAAAKRNYAWDTNYAHGEGINLTKDKQYLLSQTSNTGKFQSTCERILGHIGITGSGAWLPCVVASIVLPDVIVGTPTFMNELPANFPNPLDNDGTDDWPLFQPMMMSNTAGEDTWEKYDSKAKRIIKKDNSLWTILRPLEDVAFSNDKLWHIQRCLSSFRE